VNKKAFEIWLVGCERNQSIPAKVSASVGSRMDCCLFYLLFVDHLYHLEAFARYNAYLIHVLLLRLHLDCLHRRLKNATLQALLASTNRLDRGDEDVPAFRLGLG
jgi:hypothetical protein